VVNIQERVDDEGLSFRDARTGQVLWRKATTDPDEGPGRGVGADIWAGNPGVEVWAAGGGVSGLFDKDGAQVGSNPPSCNFLLWWDGDPLRELLDQNRIDKYLGNRSERLLTMSGAVSNNGTKSTPALSADLLGDFREEVILRSDDNRSLRIYLTPYPTDMRIRTLMHDAQYRVAIAWQNVAYNQPPHPSFHIGDNMAAPPQPDIHVR
jgi:hypothetical protein